VSRRGRAVSLDAPASLRLDWHTADVEDATCLCGPVRIDARQLRVDAAFASRQGRTFVVASEAVAEA
jgi:hypothetical protein